MEVDNVRKSMPSSRSQKTSIIPSDGGWETSVWLWRLCWRNGLGRPDSPKWVFLATWFVFFDFHFRVVKPAVLEALGMVERGPGHRRGCGAEEDAENPILLNTRTGQPYSAYQVRTTLHRFVQSVDPELTSVTPSSLRSSYATWQFQAYREGQIFQGLREDDFLDTLGKIMNTSPEQLKATYIACSAMDSNYDLIMTEVHELFRREEQGEHVL
jgi:hypothetical protein